MKQVWYADDASALGLVDDLRGWWDELHDQVGPKIWLFPKLIQNLIG